MNAPQIGGPELEALLWRAGMSVVVTVTVVSVAAGWMGARLLRSAWKTLRP